MVLNSIKLKQLNVELVKSSLKASGIGTKNSIAKDTGLSVATCRNILDELIVSGEVKEIEQGASTGGRPSRRFVYNENYAYIALIYLRIEGDSKSICTSVVNMSGTQIYADTQAFDDIGIKDIDLVVERLIEKYPEIMVISLGIPGVVQNGIIELCDFTNLQDVNIERYVSDRFNKLVTVENDVNATALGYYQRLESDVPESLVYIYYPQQDCAGAGIIINGKVIKGKNNFAGEISYMPHCSKHEEQGHLPRDSKIFTDLIVDTILTVNCLLNPDCIVISGQWITDGLKKELQKAVNAASPKQHIPGIDFESDIHDSYIDGLKFAGLQKLSCGFEVVERSYK